MIWFSCSQCGKSLSRAESSAGAFIFCACGNGMVVPWESTAEPGPEPPRDLPPPIPTGPAMPSASSGDEEIPVARPAKVAPPYVDLAAPLRGQSHRDAEKCFNHQDRPLLEKCAACGEGFCADCVVHLRGDALCGPCKNFRFRQGAAPSRASIKAIAGLLLSLCLAPALLCLWPIGGNVSGIVGVVGALGSLAGQAVAMLLAGLALREVTRDPNLIGRTLAFTTFLAGGVSSVISIAFVLFGPR
jgi:hypothetical protein